MIPDHWLRAQGLGIFGTFLLLRVARRLEGRWDSAVNAQVARPSRRSDNSHIQTLALPGMADDLDAAIEAFAEAAGFGDPADFRQPIYLVGWCTGLVLRYATRGDAADVSELARLAPIVLGHPTLAPDYRQQCVAYLALALLRRLAAADIPIDHLSGLTTMLAPSAQADLSTLIAMTRRMASDESDQSPELSMLDAALSTIRADADLTDADLTASYARYRAALPGLARMPALQAVVLHLTATTGAELVRRGRAGPAVALEVTAAYQQALRQLPAGHPNRRQISADAAEFDRRQQLQPARPAQQALPAEQDTPGLAPRYRLPADAEPFDPLAVPLLGAVSHGRLAAPAGRVIELAGLALAKAPKDEVQRACIRSVLALALHQRWLRERGDSHLAEAISHARAAIGQLPPDHPLARLSQLLAGLLIDRCQVSGDHADARAAAGLLTTLSQQIALGREIADVPVPDLNELLLTLVSLQARRGADPAALCQLLLPAPAGAGAADAFEAELAADTGAALLHCALLSGRAGDHAVRHRETGRSRQGPAGRQPALAGRAQQPQPGPAGPGAGRRRRGQGPGAGRRHARCCGCLPARAPAPDGAAGPRRRGAGRRRACLSARGERQGHHPARRGAASRGPPDLRGAVTLPARPRPGARHPVRPHGRRGRS